MKGCREHECAPGGADPAYRKILWWALALNLAMFSVEIVASLKAQSVSLRADALDFLGDAANYGIGLMVVGLTLRWRAAAALFKGAVMVGFGSWVGAVAADQALARVVPEPHTIGAVGLLALAANLVVAALLFRFRRDDPNAISVWLCTRNDCVVNVAVILAGVGVWTTGSGWPDIAVAVVVIALAVSSGVRVIRLAWRELAPASAAAPSG
jgi:Co/Zn/Cd efflux system component